MKHINSINWWIVLGIVLFSACSRDYLRYDTSQKDGAYWTLVGDSLPYGFSSTYLIDSTSLNIYIQIMGMPRDYDRAVGVELIDSLTTGEENIHYFLGKEAIVKAGEVETSLPLTLYRNRDPEASFKRVSIGFRLKANEDFDLVPGMGGSAPYRVILQLQQVARPGWWSDTYLGSFSEELYGAFMKQLASLETTNPTIYKTLYSYLSGWNASYIWQNYEYVTVKYIVHPLYDYYQENPHPDVNIPMPKY